MAGAVDSYLGGIYYDPSHPAGYSGAEPLIKYVGRRFDPQTVKEWLRSQDTYTLHKPIRRNFKRNRYIVNNIDQLWQADLNDMRSLSKYNDGVNYLLAVIDVFSKYGFMVPLKNKSGATVVKAFDSIFKSTGRTPDNLQTDKGSEFTSAETKRLFKSHDINYYTTKNPDVKAAVVERWNRTIKTRMWRYLTHKNTYRYIDVLDDLVKAYNKSKHRTIKMAPVDVSDERVLEVWRNMRPKQIKAGKPKFRVGDTVRITREKKFFQKGYETKWSEEMFKIKRVVTHIKPVYELEDLNGEVLDGYFYEPELQRVKIEQGRLYKIDKIVSTDGKGRSKRYLVKWKGYPSQFNSWVPASDLVKLEHGE